LRTKRCTRRGGIRKASCHAKQGADQGTRYRHDGLGSVCTFVSSRE